MSSNVRVLCIGNVMVDVIAQLQGDIHYGGDTRAKISTHGGGAAANVATWLAHLGADVHLCARVGTDAYGTSVLAELDSYGVKHSSLIFEGSTGTVIILVSPDGERTMFPDWAINSTLSADDLPPLNFSVALVSGYPLIDPQSRSETAKMLQKLKSSGIPIILDPGTVGALKEVETKDISSWLEYVDLLIMNQEEADFLSPLTSEVPITVIKRGKDGATACERGHNPVEVLALPSKVVDTTGAGDAFAAGFINAWASGVDIASSLKAGSETAAIAVATVGARPPR